jgi:DNA-binding response OmpR family regulator
VDFVRRGGIDVAVLGFDPPSDGLATLRLIRVVNQLLPCMMVAREVSTLLLRQALTLGVSSVLTEPIDMQFMTALIGRLLPMTAGRSAVTGSCGGFQT